MAAMVLPVDEEDSRRICQTDPRVRDLLYEATAWHFNTEEMEKRNTHVRVFSDFKMRMAALVGADRADSGPQFLFSERTYESMMRVLAFRLGF